nr:carboxylesterase CarE5 [Agrotis ipsilon]
MVKFILLLCLCVAHCWAERVIVATRKGVIVGTKHDGYNSFLGIPYALVNEENPFGGTQPYPKFDTPFTANDSSIICPQVYFSEKGIIQCLRLNIYVPHKASTKPLPILVWFHGGGFAFGSAGEYGGQYLVKKDIVVITVNYRLGAYGFLCLNEPSVTGNHGMKDQIEALRWIRSHISNFGGDPEKVTIAGESYGGGGVDLHLYSPYEHLFDKVIVQSGSIFVTEGIFVEPDHRAAIKLARHLRSEVKTTSEALKVLAKASPVEVNAATRHLKMILTLCKEEKFKGVANFVTEDPFHLRNKERVKHTKIMIGYTSQEMLYEFVNKPLIFYNESGNPFVQQLRNTFTFSKHKLETLSNIVQNFYLGGKEIGPAVELELSNFLSDFAINYGVEWSVNRYMEQDAEVYKYVFSYIGGSDYQNVTGAGATHTEELKYLFDWVWAKPLTTPEQLMMRDRITTMWANFVKYGNPTPEETDLLPVKWTPVTGPTRPYMNIDVDMEMKERVFRHRMAFWELFWHDHLKSHFLLN